MKSVPKRAIGKGLASKIRPFAMTREDSFSTVSESTISTMTNKSVHEGFESDNDASISNLGDFGMDSQLCVRKPTPPKSQYEDSLVDCEFKDFLGDVTVPETKCEDTDKKLCIDVQRRCTDQEAVGKNSNVNSTIGVAAQSRTKQDCNKAVKFHNHSVADIVTKLKSGVKLRDRKKKLSTYRSCFTGSEAVQIFVNEKLVEKQDAIQLGNLLMKMNYIRHVTGSRLFKDNDNVYYQFVSRMYRTTSEGSDERTASECQLQVTDFDLSTIDEAMQMVINGVNGISYDWFVVTYKPYYLGMTGVERMLEQGYALDESAAKFVGEKAFDSVLNNLKKFPTLSPKPNSAADSMRVTFQTPSQGGYNDSENLSKKGLKVKDKAKNRKMLRALGNESVLRANRHFYTNYQ
eukprot:CFRG4635T1